MASLPASFQNQGDGPYGQLGQLITIKFRDVSQIWGLHEVHEPDEAHGVHDCTVLDANGWLDPGRGWGFGLRETKPS